MIDPKAMRRRINSMIEQDVDDSIPKEMNPNSLEFDLLVDKNNSKLKRKNEAPDGPITKRSRWCEFSENETEQNDLVELDLLMKAIQEIDPTNNFEKEAVDSFSLEYLDQEAFD